MNRFLKGIVIFLALIAVGVVSAFAVIALLLRQEDVRVPDLVGQDIISVIDVVNQQGLQLKVDSRQPSQTVPKDAIVSQTPPPGTGIKKGRALRVVVSLGPSEMLAPKLTGEQYRKAELILRQAGYPAPDIARIWSDSVERDLVISQDPPPHTPVAPGAQVGILVSLGKKKPLYVTPRLLGRPAEESLKAVDRMGLQHRLITRPAATGSTPGRERIVVAQRPQPGYPIAADGTVELEVSK
ncbi:MAG: PASTA domain-containing protein [Nitrospiraceae bacterium]|nr:PASTA domain-containing protein [Nitrospiraceae bacterium]